MLLFSVAVRQCHCIVDVESDRVVGVQMLYMPVKGDYPLRRMLPSTGRARL